MGRMSTSHDGTICSPRLCPSPMLKGGMVLTPLPYTSELFCMAEGSQSISRPSSVVKIHLYYEYNCEMSGSFPECCHLSTASHKVIWHQKNSAALSVQPLH